MQSYDYAHRQGIRMLSWEDFATLGAQLAAQVNTASLVSHTWAPDFTVLVTDGLVVFPWAQKVLIDGHWRPHPEILAASQAQGAAKSSLPTKNTTSEV